MPPDGVLLDLRSLLGRERSGLLQDHIRHLCLADVVDHRGVGDLVRPRLAVAKGQRERTGVVRDVLQVQPRVRVARLHDRRQHRQRLPRLLLALLAALPQLGGERDGAESGEHEERQPHRQLVAEVGVRIVEPQRCQDEQAGPQRCEHCRADRAVRHGTGDDERHVHQPEVGFVSCVPHLAERPERCNDDCQVVEDDAGRTLQVHPSFEDEVRQSEVVEDSGGTAEDDALPPRQVVRQKNRADHQQTDRRPHDQKRALQRLVARREERFDAVAQPPPERWLPADAYGDAERRIPVRKLNNTHTQEWSVRRPVSLLGRTGCRPPVRIRLACRASRPADTMQVRTAGD